MRLQHIEGGTVFWLWWAFSLSLSPLSLSDEKYVNPFSPDNLLLILDYLLLVASMQV